jgi:hypothetical protein
MGGHRASAIQNVISAVTNANNAVSNISGLDFVGGNVRVNVNNFVGRQPQQEDID